jgi:hypothetical protein
MPTPILILTILPLLLNPPIHHHRPYRLDALLDRHLSHASHLLRLGFRLLTALLQARVIQLKRVRHVEIVVLQRGARGNDVFDYGVVFLDEIDLLQSHQHVVSGYRILGEESDDGGIEIVER